MLRWFTAAALVLACTPAFALQTVAKKGLKFGAECVGPVSVLAPKLGTCAIAAAKMRIWCPNGDIFDREQDKPHVSLVRSICNMTQVP